MAAEDVKVEVEFTSGTWTNITDFVWEATGGRGRSYERGDIDSGSMSFVLDNRDGRFFPTNSSSPYFPEVKLFKRIRVSLSHAGFTKILWTGYVERWPVEYAMTGGHFQVTGITAVDVMGALNRIQLKGIYERFILNNMDPYRYWPLTDRNVNGLYFCRVTGKPAAEMTYGGGLKVSQSESPLLGDEGQSVPLFEPSRAGMPNDDDPPENFSMIRLTHGPEAELPPNQVWSVMVSFFVPPGTAQIGACVLLNISDANAAQANFIQIIAGSGFNNSLQFHLNDFTGNSETLDTRQNVYDGFQHTVYFEMSSAAEDTWKWSLDGLTIQTETGINYDFNDIATRGTMDIGASWPVSNSNHAQAYAGFASNVIVFDRALTQTEVTDLAKLANGGGHINNLGDRIELILDTAGYPNALGAEVGVGESSFQGAHTVGQTAAQAITDANSWELGNSFVSGDGLIVPVARHARANPVVQHNLGFGSGGGTVYPIAELEFSFDAEHLVNDATVTVRDGGVVRATDDVSITDNGLFAAAETIEVVDESDALARAQWLVSQYAQPGLRINAVVLQAAGNQDMWNLLTQLDINQCVRIEHKPLAGNETANKVCWVESIDYDIKPGVFNVRLQLSPAVTEDFLTLGHATLGKIGAADDNKLAY